MLTDAALRSKVDALWDKLWSGGLSNPLDAIEQLSFLLFLKRLDDPQTNPKNLPIRELGEHIAFLTSGSRGWAQHYVKSGARFIRSLDVQMNHIPNDNAVFVDAPPTPEAVRTKVKVGDVLLTVTGSRIGRVAPVPQSLEGAFVSQHVAIIRLRPGLLPRFLSMFLSLETGGQLEIRRFQYGQTKPGLALNQIGKFLIQVPPLERQREFTALADPPFNPNPCAKPSTCFKRCCTKRSGACCEAAQPTQFISVEITLRPGAQQFPL